jgi:hypothetical protein
MLSTFTASNVLLVIILEEVIRTCLSRSSIWERNFRICFRCWEANRRWTAKLDPDPIPDPVLDRNLSTTWTTNLKVLHFRSRLKSSIGNTKDWRGVESKRTVDSSLLFLARFLFKWHTVDVSQSCFVFVCRTNNTWRSKNYWKSIKLTFFSMLFYKKMGWLQNRLVVCKFWFHMNNKCNDNTKTKQNNNVVAG